MIRILLITESLIKGGKERRLVELLKGISVNKEIECMLVIFNNVIQYPEIENYGIPIHCLPRRFKKDPRLFYDFYRVCKQFNPQVIHSWGSMPSVYSIPVTVMLRIKFINAMISNAICRKGSKNHFRSLLTFPFSDVIVANSKAGLKAYHVPVEKGLVIYNGFDFKRIENLLSVKTIQDTLGIRSAFVIGMVGAFHKRKDYSTFIKAAEILLHRNHNIVFLAIGDGSMLAEIKAQVNADFKDDIKFTGLVHNTESYINIFDIGILLTNPANHEEGISNSILEYMALAKPVIATRGGGTTEIVDDGETGFLIEPFDVLNLVQKIELLMADDNLRKEFGENGRRKVSTLFSITGMIDNTLKLYHSLINTQK